MKKLSFFLLASMFSAGVYAQGLDAALEQSVAKDKEKSDKAITDAKASGKASTWMDRAKTYESIAVQFVKLDSNAAMVAYDAYKKVIELDKDKKGGPGKLAKEAETAMKGQGMYNAFMQTGAAKYQAKNFADATKLMALAGEVMPKDTTAALYAGIAAQQAQNMAVAKEQFERYMTAGGKDPSVIYTLSNIYRQEKNVDKALATLEKGLQVLPTNKDLQAERVNIMLAAGRMDEAIASMKQLVEREPNNAQNLLNLGILYDNSANEAEKEIQKVSESVKKGPDLNKQLTTQKDALSAMQGEVTRLSARAKKEPKNADVKRQLTQVNQMITDKKAEIAQTEKDIQAQQNQPKTGVDNPEQKLADLTKRQQEYRTSAKDYYTRALQVDPNNYDANFNMGALYFNEAVAMNRQLSNMDMKEYQAKGKEVEGRACGRFKQALPYLEKAKSIKDTEEDLNENLNSLRDILKQFEEKKVVCVESK
ncbi:hypothetical protein GCM10023189_11900 [Nibrella saemangeumensis]|uniref:Tetratricopeptide repeat protein n=1 Tax=Nibrella saemangeumensis TaxID=1084526 RepID=A0ABP8MK57_9BACT